MKRWIAAAFLLAAGITAGLPAEEVVDFTREKLPVVLHRPQEKAQGFAYGRRGLEISWDCAKARHFEFCLFTRICGRNPVPGVRQAGDISTLLQF